MDGWMERLESLLACFNPYRRWYRDNLQSRAEGGERVVFTVTSVQRATEAAVHAGFMRCLHSRKAAANTAFRQQPRTHVTTAPLRLVCLKAKLLLFVR